MNNIVQLIIRNFILNKRKYLTVYLAVSLTLTVIFFIQTYAMKMVSYSSMANIFFFVYIMGGFLFTSNAFNELESPAKSSFYLLLPASHIEKFIAQYLVVSVIYSIIALASFFILATIGSSLASLTFDIYFNFNDYQYIPQFAHVAKFLVLQTVFLCGALHFKNNAFFKTLLSIMIFNIAMAIIAGLFTWMVFGTAQFEFDGMNFNDSFLNFNHFEITAKVLFWYILGPFFLVVSYFKLTEKEV